MEKSTAESIGSGIWKGVKAGGAATWKAGKASKALKAAGGGGGSGSPWGVQESGFADCVFGRAAAACDFVGVGGRAASMAIRPSPTTSSTMAP